MMSRMMEGEWKKDARKGLPSSAANIASLQRNKRHTRERARRLALSFLFPLSPTLSLSDFSSPSSFISQTGPLPTKNKTRSPPQGPERLPSPQALLEQTLQATETDAVASRGKREKNLKDTEPTRENDADADNAGDKEESPPRPRPDLHRRGRRGGAPFWPQAGRIRRSCDRRSGLCRRSEERRRRGQQRQQQQRPTFARARPNRRRRAPPPGSAGRDPGPNRLRL